MISATGMFAYMEVIYKVHIKFLLASDRVRKCWQIYMIFKIKEFAANCDIRCTRCLSMLKLNDPYDAPIGLARQLFL